MKKETILILAAHPDDEVLGCGGVIQKYVAQGDRVVVCIITDGSSSQYHNNSVEARQKVEECKTATSMLGVHDLVWLNFPDMKLDTIPHIELNRKIEEVFARFKPSIVYTHSAGDVNRDHIEIYKSSEVVCRPGKPYLKKIFAYEVLSSSEWSKNNIFKPNTFVDINPYLETKINAFLAYKTEVRSYPHPRSPEGLKILAQYRGLQANMKTAEAFKLITDYEL